ncbi:MAG TPA: DUF4124 domain-containing protein [Burkholderiales bacterium]|nr:DUF4124 domain-containing protein [Burkholderiales bacterium]
MRANPVVVAAGLALALAQANAAMAAKIFKWTDERGVTHYGEVIPPEYKDQAAQEMSKQGLTIRKWDSAITPEQRKAAELKAVRERDDKQRDFEQRRRDLALVNTYTSAREIDEHRDRTLQLPVQAIRGLEPRLKRAQDRLAALQRQAAAFTDAGKQVPNGLELDLADERSEVSSIRAEIDRHKAEIEVIKVKYDGDKKRYLELTQR